MSRPRFPRLAAALVLAAFATAGPALAQDQTGFWRLADGGSLSIKTQTSIDPLTQVITARALMQLRYASGAWAVCVGDLGTGPQGGQRQFLTCPLSTFRNGQPFGGAWREAEGSFAGQATVDFYQKIINAPGVSTTIERVVLPGGGLDLPSIANAPFTTVYVMQLRHPDNRMEAPLFGTGFFIEAQGSAVRLDINTFTEAGNPIGATLDGQCVMNANFTCIVTGDLLLADGRSLGSMTLMLGMNGSPHMLYPGESFPTVPPTDPEKRLAVHAWN